MRVPNLAHLTPSARLPEAHRGVFSAGNTGDCICKVIQGVVLNIETDLAVYAVLGDSRKPGAPGVETAEATPAIPGLYLLKIIVNLALRTNLGMWRQSETDVGQGR